MSGRQKAIRDGLADSGRFLSAQDLHGRLRGAGVRVGLTTVYRALQLLAARGDADVVVREDGQRAYRACTSGAHHHHLICRHCGDAAEVHEVELERWAADTGRLHGFTGLTHIAEVFGTCPSCSVAQRVPQSAAVPGSRSPA
jgi:Fur family transcriptional regulator, ferric uptake regulator